MKLSKPWIPMGIFVLVLVVLGLLSEVLTPFLIAALLAYLTTPIVDCLQAWKIPRTLAIVFVFFLVLVLIAVLLVYWVPLLEQQMLSLIHTPNDAYK